jgi:hypothetical protein
MGLYLTNLSCKSNNKSLVEESLINVLNKFGLKLAKKEIVTGSSGKPNQFEIVEEGNNDQVTEIIANTINARSSLLLTKNLKCLFGLIRSNKNTIP